jgi:hypothetical protein
MNEHRQRVRRGVTFLMIVTTVVWLSVVAYHAVCGITVSSEGGILQAFGTIAAWGFFLALAYLATMAVLGTALLLIRERKSPRT